ncbi:transposase [Streptomyces olivaceoviridis]
MLGARVLAELGDDRARFTDARALKSYAGSAPIT